MGRIFSPPASQLLFIQDVCLQVTRGVSRPVSPGSTNPQQSALEWRCAGLRTGMMPGEGQGGLESKERESYPRGGEASHDANLD